MNRKRRQEQAVDMIRRRDLYWTMAMAGVVLIAVVVFWLGDKDNEIVSHLSFASALISIVLALVAIFYSIVHNVNSQQNLGEMKTLVSEASRIITGKAESMENLVRSQQDLMGLRETPSVSGGTHNASVSFRLSHTSHLTRLFTVFLLRSHTVDKPLPIKELVEIVKPLVRMSEAQLSSHTYGILHGVSCCLWEYLKVDAQTNVQLQSLPPGFASCVESIKTVMATQDGSGKLAECVEAIEGIS